MNQSNKEPAKDEWLEGNPKLLEHDPIGLFYLTIIFTPSLIIY